MNAGLLSVAKRRALVALTIAFGLGASLYLLFLASPAAPSAHAQGEGKSVLLYTGTTGFRHSGAISSGQPIIQSALEDLGYEVDWEDCNGFGTTGDGCHAPENNPSIFTTENLANYDAIMLFNASDWWTGGGGEAGQLFDADQEAAIIDFVQNGGGIAANHNAVDMAQGDVVSWDWWDGDENSVVGTRMGSHGPTQIGNEATVQVADRNHPSTRDLPDTYDFGDEHYNFFDNVRGTHHVLATLDERTYNNSGGNPTGRQDHPISWCKSYDGDNIEDGTGTPKNYNDGRSWVSGMGHFGASYSENGGDNELVNHIVGGIRWVAGEGNKSDCGGTVWENYSREILVDDTNGAIAVDVADDGKVYWTEIGPNPGFESEGYVRMHDPQGPPNNNTLVATIETRADHNLSEDGVLGMSLQPGFDLSDPDSRDIYVYHSPRGEGEDWPTSGDEIAVGYNQISRFTLNGDGTAFEPDSEQVILRVDKAKISGAPFGDANPGHVGGAGMVFDAEGNLVLGVGDDVSPNASGHGGFAPMDHRRPERWDARKTSANTGDLRGKILRIDPIEGASGVEPGVGQTYEIPATNLFAGDEDPLTRPEIWAMGFRQPFTVHADPENPDTVVVGEYCHDARPEQVDRSPDGTCEWNLVDEPAFHGWPFCVGDNSADDPLNTMTRWDYTNGTSTGDKYDCSLSALPADLRYDPPGGGDDSSEPTNDGLDEIPGPAAEATIWKDYDGDYPDEHFGDLSAGGMQPVTGPIYRYNGEPAGIGGRFPAYWDGSWLIHNRGNDNGFWKEVRLREDNNEMLRVHDFMPANNFGSPNNSLVIGTRFGPDGALYTTKFPVGCCRPGLGSGDEEPLMKISFEVQDECLADDQAPNVSHTIDGQPHPTEPDTWVSNNGPAELSITANDVGCAGVDTIQYRLDPEDDWTEYEGSIPFPDPGSYEVEYRATDSFDPPNTSEVATASFDVVEVDDTDAPTVDAEVSGPTTAEGDYNGQATVEISAEDEISPITSIEHSTDGGATWTTETFDPAEAEYDDGFAQSLEAEFTEPGEYTVDYRATDEPGNTSEAGQVTFTIVETDDCVPEMSDEFDGAALDTEKWNVRVDDPGEYRIEDGQLVLPTLNEVDGTETGPLALVSQDVPEGDWSLTTRVTPDLESSWAQAGIMLWQSDGNFVKYVFGRTADGGDRRIEMASDDPIDNRNTGDNADVPNDTETVWLRLNREGNTIFGEWAFDEDGEPGEWQQPAIQTRPVDTNPPREGEGVQLGLYAGSDIDGEPYEQEAAFDFARFEPDEFDCPTQPCLSDEFDGAALDTTKWELVRSDPERDDPTVADGDLVLPLGSNSVDQAREGPLTMLGQPLPDGDFTMEAEIDAPGLNEDTGNVDSDFAQVGFKLFQTDDDWIKVAHTRDAGGGGTTNTYFEIVYEDEGGRVLGDQVANQAAELNLPTFWLRVSRNGDQISAEFANEDPSAGGSWQPLTIDGGTTASLGIFDPADGPVHIGAYGGNGTIDALYDYIRFSPEDPACESGGDDTTPPETSHSLDPEDPGEGGTYSGPVDVTLSATDPGFGDETPEPENHDVQAVGTSWEPNELEIAFGDQVTWHPEDPGLFHDANVVAPDEDPGAEGTQVGELPSGGDPVSFTFDQEGTWTFYCEPHSFINSEGEWDGMVGTIEVGPDPGSGPVGTGVDFTEYRVNTDGATGEWVQSDNDEADPADPFETTFEVSEQGDHVVEYRSTDNAGNEEEVKSFPFSIDEGAEDNTPPVTTHMLVPTQPGDGGTYDRMVRVVLNASDEAGGSGVADTFYRVTKDGEAGEWETYMDMMPPELTDDGEYTVEYYSVDNAGNEEDPPGSVSFEIDTGDGGTPELKVTGAPKKRTVGKNQRQTVFRMRAKNKGDADTGRVRLCATAPPKRLKVRGPRCVTRNNIAPGKRKIRRVRVRIKPAARGTTSPIRLIGNGPNVDKQRVVVRLRVR